MVINLAEIKLFLSQPFNFIYDKLNLKFINEKSYKKLISQYKIEKRAKNFGNKNIFICNGEIEHGGYTDRLQGILTTYYLTKLVKRPFKIHWDSPFDLNKYLTPNAYDWRLKSSSIQIENLGYQPLIFFLHSNKYRFRNYLGYIILSLYIFRHKNGFHFYTNYKFPKFKFKELYNELFRPTPVLLSEINRHLNLLGSKYWSISFRFLRSLNDFLDGAGEILDLKKRENLINKNIKELKKFLKLLPTDYRCLITSDSSTFLENVKNLDSRIYIVEGQISHLDFVNIKDKINCGKTDPWLKLFIDHHLIMNAECVYLFKTENMYRSRFSETAALIGGKKFILHEF